MSCFALENVGRVGRFKMRLYLVKKLINLLDLELSFVLVIYHAHNPIELTHNTVSHNNIPILGGQSRTYTDS